VIIFGLVRFLSKKITKLKFFFWKKTETKPKPDQTDRFRFGFLGKNRFKLVWLGFFRFFSVSVRFFAYKTETEPAGFFKILIGLINFFSVRFF
jgi:hypothetical protein